MTRADILKHWPNASESLIVANLSAAEKPAECPRCRISVKRCVCVHRPFIEPQPPKTLTARSAGHLSAKKGISGDNKKVRNAQKVEVHGIKFDSKLELHMWEELTRYGIQFEFQKKYVLQEKFKYLGESIREMTLTVDFWVPELNVIVDSKGWASETAPLKYKLLKWKLNFDLDQPVGRPPKIYMPKNKKECSALALEIFSTIKK